MVCMLMHLMSTCENGEDFNHNIIISNLNVDMIEPNIQTRALVNEVDKHSFIVVKHGATHHTRTSTTISDTHIDVIIVDTNDRLIKYN